MTTPDTYEAEFLELAGKPGMDVGGWQKPLSYLAKYHYFPAGDNTSLCCGRLSQGPERSPDKAIAEADRCAGCRKIHARQSAEKEAGE